MTYWLYLLLRLVQLPPTTPPAPAPAPPAVALAHQLEQTFGLRPTAAAAHAAAACAAATPAFTAELLVAIVAKETDFQATSVSRVVPKWRPQGPPNLFCGVLQAMAGTSWARCRALQALPLGYAEGVAELATWHATCKGDLDCVLASHACGNAATQPRCRSYARQVWARVAALRQGKAFKGF